MLFTDDLFQHYAVVFAALNRWLEMTAYQDFIDEWHNDIGGEG